MIRTGTALRRAQRAGRVAAGGRAAPDSRSGSGTGDPVNEPCLTATADTASRRARGQRWAESSQPDYKPVSVRPQRRAHGHSRARGRQLAAVHHELPSDDDEGDAR